MTVWPKVTGVERVSLTSMPLIATLEAAIAEPLTRMKKRKRVGTCDVLSASSKVMTRVAPLIVALTNPGGVSGTVPLTRILGMFVWVAQVPIVAALPQ